MQNYTYVCKLHFSALACHLHAIRHLSALAISTAQSAIRPFHALAIAR